MDDPIVIVDAEMMTAVGSSAAQTATSARARVMRVTEVDFCDYYHTGFRVGVIPQESLPQLNSSLQDLPLTDRERRMLRLAGDPLARLVSKIPSAAGAPSVSIGLSEHQNRRPIEPGTLMEQLYKQAGLDLSASAATTIMQGRAAALLALESGMNALRSGTAQFAIAGGIDSFIDLYILGTLEMQKRIRTDRNADGFAPGEGAGFCLMTTEKIAAKHGMSVLARIDSVGTAMESGHFYSDQPYLGNGLSEAFSNCIGGSNETPPIDCVFASFNGERYWAKEFSVAMLRHKPQFSDDCQMEHPAECCGDMGAASGGIMLGLAAMQLKRSNRGGATLVYCSSDYGQRAAALLTAA